MSDRLTKERLQELIDEWDDINPYGCDDRTYAIQLVAIQAIRATLRTLWDVEP